MCSPQTSLLGFPTENGYDSSTLQISFAVCPFLDSVLSTILGLIIGKKEALPLGNCGRDLGKLEHLWAQ